MFSTTPTAPASAPPGTSGRIAAAPFGRADDSPTRWGSYLDAMNVLNVGLAHSYIGSSGPFFGLPNAWTDPPTLRLTF